MRWEHPISLLVAPFLPFVAVAWSVVLGVGFAVAAFSGRVDLRRGVRDGSAAAVGLLLVAASGLLLLAHGTTAVEPGGVDEIAVVRPVPNRPWLLLHGKVTRWSHGWWTSFLVDGSLRPARAGFHPGWGAGGTLVVRGRNALFRLEPDGTPVRVPLAS